MNRKEFLKLMGLGSASLVVGAEQLFGAAPEGPWNPIEEELELIEEHKGKDDWANVYSALAVSAVFSYYVGKGVFKGTPFNKESVAAVNAAFASRQALLRISDHGHEADHELKLTAEAIVVALGLIAMSDFTNSAIKLDLERVINEVKENFEPIPLYTTEFLAENKPSFSDSVAKWEAWLETTKQHTSRQASRILGITMALAPLGTTYSSSAVANDMKKEMLRILYEYKYAQNVVLASQNPAAIEVQVLGKSHTLRKEKKKLEKQAHSSQIKLANLLGKDFRAWVELVHHNEVDHATILSRFPLESLLANKETASFFRGISINHHETPQENLNIILKAIDRAFRSGETSSVKEDMERHLKGEKLGKISKIFTRGHQFLELSEVLHHFDSQSREIQERLDILNGGRDPEKFSVIAESEADRAMNHAAGFHNLCLFLSANTQGALLLGDPPELLFMMNHKDNPERISKSIALGAVLSTGFTNAMLASWLKQQNISPVDSLKVMPNSLATLGDIVKSIRRGGNPEKLAETIQSLGESTGLSNEDAVEYAQKILEYMKGSPMRLQASQYIREKKEYISSSKIFSKILQGILDKVSSHQINPKIFKVAGGDVLEGEGLASQEAVAELQKIFDEDADAYRKLIEGLKECKEDLPATSPVSEDQGGLPEKDPSSQVHKAIDTIKDLLEAHFPGLKNQKPSKEEKFFFGILEACKRNDPSFDGSTVFADIKDQTLRDSLYVQIKEHYDLDLTEEDFLKLSLLLIQKNYRGFDPKKFEKEWKKVLAEEYDPADDAVLGYQSLSPDEQREEDLEEHDKKNIQYTYLKVVLSESSFDFEKYKENIYKVFPEFQGMEKENILSKIQEICNEGDHHKAFLHHSAQEVFFALMTQIPAVESIVYLTDRTLPKAFGVKESEKPSFEQIKGMTLSTLIAVAGFSAFADNIAAYMFGEAVLKKIVFKRYKNTQETEKEFFQRNPEILDYIAIFSKIIAELAGALTLIGNGANFTQKILKIVFKSLKEGKGLDINEIDNTLSNSMKNTYSISGVIAIIGLAYTALSSAMISLEKSLVSSNSLHSVAKEQIHKTRGTISQK